MKQRLVKAVLVSLVLFGVLFTNLLARVFQYSFNEQRSGASRGNNIEIALQQHQQQQQQQRNEQSNDDVRQHIQLYDMHTRLDENWTNCVNTTELIVRAIICIHDIKRDVFVSKAIRYDGAWKREIINALVEMLKIDAGLHVIDVGANIGQYCLYAAFHGRSCVVVEPFVDSYMRLHMSAQIGGFSDRITMVTNGVSNQRGEIKRLQADRFSVSDQGTNPSAKIDELSEENRKYLLRTIELNDLRLVLPHNFTRAILKIDIGRDVLPAFEKASLLFQAVDIRAVQMEWGEHVLGDASDQQIDSFLDFMYALGYVPKNIYNFDEDLRRSNAKRWPDDIFWVRKDVQF